MKPITVARSMARNELAMSRNGIVILSSLTPMAVLRPWLSMNMKISETANSPTIATRKSTPSIRWISPKVSLGMPVWLSSPIIAIPRPIAAARAAFAWFFEASPPKVQNARR